MVYYTHAGIFHCDEVTGYSICKLAKVCNNFIRLIDLDNIPEDGIVADIGRAYLPEQNKFDHHQGLIQRKSGHPYASAGLLWKEHGYNAVFYALGGNKYSTTFIESVVERVDETLIKGIDAHDSDNNYHVDANCVAGKVRVYTLPNIVSFLNADDVKDHAAQRIAFTRATLFVEEMLLKEIVRAEQYLNDIARFDNIAQIEGEVAVLSESVRWQELVHEKHPNLKFVISPSFHPGSPYTMTAVPVEPSKRKVKIPIERPDWFKGFIHQGQWIAGGQSVTELKKLADFNL